jgi:hypothetical protein
MHGKIHSTRGISILVGAFAASSSARIYRL